MQDLLAGAGVDRAPPRAWPRWYRLFLVLAAAGVLATCVGVRLTQSLMETYRGAVQANGAWAAHLLGFARLEALAAGVHAAALDAFSARDSAAERKRMRAAAGVFDQELGALRAELQRGPAAEAAPVLVRLDAVAAAMEAMAQEAEVLAHFGAGRVSTATRRRALMERKYDAVGAALEELSRAALRTQKRGFQQHMSMAARVEDYAYVFSALVILLFAGAAFYGHRAARQMQADAVERERYLQTLARAREQLRLRSQELDYANQRLSALSRRTLERQEAERQQVARELHEEVAQLLAGVAMRLDAVALARCGGKSMQPYVASARGIARDALGRLHDVVRELTPHGMEHIGLAGVLAVHLEKWTEGSGIAVRFAEQVGEPRAPFAVETAAYRIAEEAVANALRHARARRLAVELRQAGGALQLVVEDDGAGFDVDEARRACGQERLGIAAMEQRAALAGGMLEIESRPGTGTRVRALFPAT